LIHTTPIGPLHQARLAVLVVRARVKVKVAAKETKRAVVVAQVQEYQHLHRTPLLPDTYLQESKAHGIIRIVPDPPGRLGCPNKENGSLRSIVSRRTLGKRRPVAV
jgi:hypothetical protein